MAPGGSGGGSTDEGDSIKNYEVMEVLGQGGFAIAYRGYHRSTGQEVAIKMIEKGKLQNGNMMKRVRNEVEIHCQLKHPSILELYSYFEDSGHVYLVLELCHNGEVQKYLKQLNGGMREDEVQKIMLQVVVGLLYLHSHGILHRDLSLGNLLLTKNMDVKIADFGLAAKLNMPTDKHFTMCGTPNYISPEIATRSPHGLESDVWSLGCMLYTFLVGRPPFDTDAVKTTLNKVVLAQYHIPSYLSPQAKDLIDKLLKKNPNDRITLSGILDHPFMLKDGANVKPYVSVDSGHGTLSITTNTASSLMDSAYKPNHPPSPPVRLRARNNIFNNGKENHIPPYQRVNEVRTHAFPSNTSSSMHSVNDTSGGRHCNSSSARGISFTGCVNHSHCSCSSTHSSNRMSDTSKVLSDITNFSNRANKSVGVYNATPVNNRRTANQSLASKENYFNDENAPYLKQSLEKTMDPLSSIRLRPIRQKTRNAVVSILEDSSICLEFIQNRGGIEYVVEVLRISEDGIKVTIFSPNGKIGVPLCETPHSVPSTAISYAFSALPQKYWKKYQYADKFVRLVKMKTPKITFYSDRSKCSLMENIPPDFESVFYDGCKVNITSDLYKIIDENGKTVKVDKEKESTLSSTQRDLIEHCKNCFEHCRLLENAISVLEGEREWGSYFPLIVGRRPTQKKDSKEQDYQKNDGAGLSIAPNSPQSSVPASVSVMSYDGTLISDCKHVSPARLKSISALPSKPKGPVRASSTSSLERIGEYAESVNFVKSIFVHNTGWASQLHNGDFQIQYNDGTQLKFQPSLQIVQYTSQDSATKCYRKTDSLPVELKNKLTYLPSVLDELKKKT